MNKKNTIITDWLDKHGDPQIEKRVMERLDKITKELIIDEAYALYLNESGYTIILKVLLYQKKNSSTNVKPILSSLKHGD